MRWSQVRLRLRPFVACHPFSLSPFPTLSSQLKTTKAPQKIKKKNSNTLPSVVVFVYPHVQDLSIYFFVVSVPFISARSVLIGPSSIPPLGGLLGCFFLLMLVVLLGWPAVRPVGRVTNPPTPDSLPCFQSVSPDTPPDFRGWQLIFPSSHWFPRVLDYGQVVVGTCKVFLPVAPPPVPKPQLQGHQLRATLLRCFAPLITRTSQDGGATVGDVSPMLPPAGIRWYDRPYCLTGDCSFDRGGHTRPS